jgi:hypothetical protein
MYVLAEVVEPATPFLVVNAQLVTLALAVVIPFLVSLVTKWSAPAWLKIGANVALSAVGAAITLSMTTDGTAVLSRQTLVLFGEQFLAALLVYLGVFKPTGVSAKLAPTFGIGPAAPKP